MDWVLGHLELISCLFSAFPWYTLQQETLHLEQTMDNLTFVKRLTQTDFHPSSLKLENGSRVAVMGGGPAGSFFSYFLLGMAERAGLQIHVDIYEPRDFDVPGPLGCNMCGGVIYESLVQSLAVEGINLPTTVVQRGIEFNMLHLDIGTAQIHTPRREKRIATTFRGLGPRGVVELNGGSLDGYLLQAAIARGAQHIRARVEEVSWLTKAGESSPRSKLIQVRGQRNAFQSYELLAVTSGVNTAAHRMFQDLEFGYDPPHTSKLLVREYYLGKDVVSKYIGPVFHAFLLDIPGLDYGAIIPKGEYVTVCLLSSHRDLDAASMGAFLDHPAVKRTMPPDFLATRIACHCGPRINTMGCKRPFGDRIVLIGDSGVSRLYKDGIGAAYRAAKIAASTALFQGVSSDDFERHYLPFCRKMEFDNQIGKLFFRLVSHIQKMKIAKRAILRMVCIEQEGRANAERGMSMVMWDMLTGGAPYMEVLLRTFHPTFLLRFLGTLAISLLFTTGIQPGASAPEGSLLQGSVKEQLLELNTMEPGALGKVYQDGETIVQQGEIGDCMYVIQEGQVEIIRDAGDREVRLATLGKNEFFGEMAIFEHEIRSATVRAMGTARILTIDHENFLRRIHEDPSLAYRMMEVMSNRVRRLSEEVVHLKQVPSVLDMEEYHKVAFKPTGSSSIC